MKNATIQQNEEKQPSSRIRKPSGVHDFPRKNGVKQC